MDSLLKTVRMDDNLQRLLEKYGRVSPEAYELASEHAKKDSISILNALEQANILEESLLLRIMSKYYKTSVVDLTKMEIPANIIALIPKDIAQHYRIVPVDKAGNNIIVAMGNPRNLKAIDAIRFNEGYFAKPVLASESKITEAIEKYYGKIDLTQIVQGADPHAKLQTRKVIGSRSDKDDGPVIKMVNDVILQCASKGASDIHVEPYEDFLRIRLRIDGALVEIARPPSSMMASLVSRIKIMAGLNIAESRLPQDGAINIKIGEKPIDFRVNTLPTAHGEKIVMRILDKSNLQVDMTQLGFDEEQLKDFKDSINRPHGMVLVTGPTGSGKTTTLYSALSELNREDLNLMTAEDPVEYNLPGINQVQMRSDIGLDFAAALRSFLRQDPDVIMVGEIRDLETAEIAMKAALTGHMVLSTLHTNSAPETVARLINMGVATFNLVSAVSCVTAQRLLRKICTKCRIEDKAMTPPVLEELGVPKNYSSRIKAYKGQGCSTCNNTGSKGRLAVHEVLVMQEAVRRSILNGDAAIDIKRVAMANGMRSLRQSALTKLAMGLVSAQEVIKTTVTDDDKQH